MVMRDIGDSGFQMLKLSQNKCSVQKGPQEHLLSPPPPNKAKKNPLTRLGTLVKKGPPKTITCWRKKIGKATGAANALGIC